MNAVQRSERLGVRSTDEPCHGVCLYISTDYSRQMHLDLCHRSSSVSAKLTESRSNQYNTTLHSFPEASSALPNTFTVTAMTGQLLRFNPDTAFLALCIPKTTILTAPPNEPYNKYAMLADYDTCIHTLNDPNLAVNNNKRVEARGRLFAMTKLVGEHIAECAAKKEALGTESSSSDDSGSSSDDGGVPVSGAVDEAEQGFEQKVAEQARKPESSEGNATEVDDLQQPTFTIQKAAQVGSEMWADPSGVPGVR